MTAVIFAVGFSLKAQNNQIQCNEQVARYVDLLVNRRSAQTEQMMQRACNYFPIIEETLQRHQLPNELKYLVMVESAMNPAATSHNGKVGLWQLDAITAKQYGLEVSDARDERKDPKNSTEAACLSLKALNSHFGDLLLAIAAYNTSVATVEQAMDRAGGDSDYWAMEKYLPLETRGYVPAFLAIIHVLDHPETYGMYPVCPATP